MCQLTESCSTCAGDCGPCGPVASGDLGHAEGDTEVAFDDVTGTSGAAGLLDCMMAHTAAVGDVNGDGYPDLFVGSFADRPDSEYACGADGPGTDRLLLGQGDGTFRRDGQPALEQRGRSSGAVFADLDNDGDLDLVVTRNPSSRSAIAMADNELFRNDGGRFVDATAGSGLVMPDLKARNVVPLDYDGDGRLDLFIVDDILGRVGSRLLHNEGGLRFRDATTEAGLPGGLLGLGAAAADVDHDGWPDLFVGHVDGLFLNDGAGRFRRVTALDSVFRWPGPEGSEDWRSGVAFGDVDRDGRLDLLVGHHYGSAYDSPRSLRLYLNRTRAPGSPEFEDATDRMGLVPIAAKAPHVEIADVDNDGWPDLVASVHASVGGGRTPLVFRNEGGTGFRAPSFTVPYDRESDLGYWPAAPTVDYDRDGRLDLVGAEWYAARGSVVYRNVSRAGSFLEVGVRVAEGGSSLGIGARVEVYEPGQLGHDAARIGSGEIMTGFGYSSGQEALARFGVADRRVVDVRVRLPHGGEVIDRPGVAVDQRLVIVP